MSRAQDLTNRQFGRLTAVEATKFRQQNNVFWRCLCACGSEHRVTAAKLLAGKVRSCGCLLSEVASARSMRHGMYGTKTYKTWSSMIQRCTNPKSPHFDRYGGRGIAVCERWRLFENFFADMGAKPEGLSIDRIDNDGNYEPGNCRWATRHQQARNKTSNVLTLERANEIRALYEAGRTPKQIVGLGYPQSGVTGVLYGKAWR